MKGPSVIEFAFHERSYGNLKAPKIAGSGPPRGDHRTLHLAGAAGWRRLVNLDVRQ
jgi:hypothetical protein